MQKPLITAFAFILLSGAMQVAQAEQIKVVTSFSILGDMVQEVGKDRIAVTSLVGADSDAHVYEPTPQDARRIAEADVLVVNGLGFEGFLPRLIEASGYQGPIITAAAGITPLTTEEGHEEHAEHEEEHAEHEHGQEHEEGEDHARHVEEEHEHHHGGQDPHAWQNPLHAIAYVTEIEKGLCAADPSGCAAFADNAKAYRAALAALDADIKARLAAVPENRRVVITDHDAFRYFGAAYGVRFLAPKGLSTEGEAAAQTVAAIISLVKETGVKAIFLENIADPRLAEQIAREARISLSGPVYSDALSGPEGEGATYLEMMRHNADLFIGAMGEGS